MTTPDEIISDDEIARVHANANFGIMTPRQVVNNGVRKYAVGFTGGSTQIAILREHGLITKPEAYGYKASLTEKGKRYARAIWAANDDAAKAQLTKAVDALTVAANRLAWASVQFDTGTNNFITVREWADEARAVLAEIAKGGAA